MRRIRVVGVLVLVLVFLSVPSAFVASASSAPDFEVYLPENVVEPGEETVLELEVRNAASPDEDADPGDIPEDEARAVTVTLEGGDAPISVKTAETPMPTMSSESLFSESFTVAVDEDAEAGVYEADVEIEYTYTASNGLERTETETETVEVVVEDRARFAGETVDSELTVGETGEVSIELTNEGVENASDAVVAVDSPAAELEAIDEDVEQHVGEWGVGETVTIDAGFSVSGDAIARTYPVDATVDFRDDDGVDRTSREIRVGAPTNTDASFVSSGVDSRLVVGETGDVSVELTNQRDDDVTDAVVELGSPDADLEDVGEDAEVYVGDWEAGETRTVSSGFALSEEAQAGTYPITATVDFRADGADRTSREVTVGAEAATRSFEAEALDSRLVVGDTGNVSLEITNVRDHPVEDASVQVSSPDPALDPLEEVTEKYVGDWEAGETRTVETRFDLSADAPAGTYPVTAVVDFRADGSDRLSREVRTGVEAADSQSFSLEDVESDLRVGEDGIVTGTVVNDGPEPVENVVVQVDDDGEEIVPEIDSGPGLGPNVFARETQYAVGDLEVGEKASFDLSFGITDEGEPGPRLLELDVRYRNADDDVRTGDPVDATVEVGDSRDEFTVEATNATIETGDTDRLELEVTNVYDEPLSDIEAKLFTNAPLEDGDDEAFVPELEPGASTTVVFELSAEEDATPQTYPVRVDFQYEEDGDRKLSDTYRVPVTVAEPEGGVPIALVVAALTGLGALFALAWWFRDPLGERLDGVPDVGRVSNLSLPGWGAEDDGERTDPAGDDDRVDGGAPEADEGTPEADDSGDVFSFGEEEDERPSDTDGIDDR